MIVEIRDEVVALSGSLRRNQWRTLESAVKVRLKHHPTGIVVDCGGLESLTPEGAETFRHAASHITAGGARIVVANVPPKIMLVLRQIPNLRSQLPLAATVAEARASLGLQTDARSRRASESPNVVVVGLLGTGADADAVTMACRLGQAMQAEVHLTYLLAVPRNVPLLTPLAEEEEAIRGTLDALDSAVRAARLLPVRRVERTRDPAGRLVEVASEVRANAVVLALPPNAPEEMTNLAESVLAGAACDVVIDRLPNPAAPPTPAGTVPARGGAR